MTFSSFDPRPEMFSSHDWIIRVQNIHDMNVKKLHYSESSNPGRVVVCLQECTVQTMGSRFLDTQVSLAPTHVRLSVGPLVHWLVGHTFGEK